MPWIQLRSRRDPAVWLPPVLVVVVLVPLAFLIYARMSDWSARVTELADTDPEAAWDQTVQGLRLGSWVMIAVIVGFGAYLFRYFQLGRREARLPPSGRWWSFGAYRALVGPDAQRRSQFGIVIASLLLAVAIGLLVLVELLIRMLDAGLTSA